jgi:large subunit ribosomal protein L21
VRYGITNHAPIAPVKQQVITTNAGIMNGCRFFLEVKVYAIVESGGRQYRAEEGNTFSVEKLPYEVGDQVELNSVLLIANGDAVQIGQPTVAGAAIKATVVEQYRGKKIFVWKYQAKLRYRRRRGHRQDYTRLRVDEIVAG